MLVRLCPWGLPLPAGCVRPSGIRVLSLSGNIRPSVSRPVPCGSKSGVQQRRSIVPERFMCCGSVSRYLRWSLMSNLGNWGSFSRGPTRGGSSSFGGRFSSGRRCHLGGLLLASPGVRVPTGQALGLLGGVPVPCITRPPHHSSPVGHYLRLGGCLAFVVGHIPYPVPS